MTTRHDVLESALTIHGSAFITGPDDDIHVEFFDLGGSIARVAYHTRSTSTVVSFVPVESWEYALLAKMAQETRDMIAVADAFGRSVIAQTADQTGGR